MIERDCKSIIGEYRRKMLSSVVFLLLLLGLVSPVSAGFNSIYQGFESGSLPVNNFTTQEESSESSIDVQSGSGGCSVSPNEGSYSLVMDTDTSGGYSANELVTTANFTDARNIQLEFYHRETGDEEESASDHSGSFPAQDGFYYTTDGNNWKSLGSLGNVGSTWTQESVNISADPDFSGPANSSFAIKIVQYDNYDCTTDGRMFDSINLSYETPSPDIWARVQPRADGTSEISARQLQGYTASQLLLTSGGTMTGDLNMSGHKITEFFGADCGSGYFLTAYFSSGATQCQQTAESLSSTLSTGNDAGNNNLDMNGNNITGVPWLNPHRDWNTGGGLDQRIVRNDSMAIDVNNSFVPLKDPRFVAYADDYAYVPSYSSDSLTAVNVTDPTDIAITDSVFSLTGATGVGVNGSYAYVTTDGRVVVVDISDPTNLNEVGSVTDQTALGAPFGLDNQGNYAYVTSGRRVTAVDVSTPSSPTVAGSVSSSILSGGYDIEAEGDRAYVASQPGEIDHYLVTVNISDPANPSILGNVTGPSLHGAFGVDVNGSYAYVSGYWDDSLNVINISDISDPKIVANISNSSYLDQARDVHFSNGKAYVAAFGNNKLTVVDVSDPLNPTIDGALRDDQSLSGAYGIDINGTEAYVTGNTGDLLNTIDISTPSSPVLDDSVQSVLGGLEFTNTMDIAGSYLYTAGNHFTVVDTDNPSVFEGVGRWEPEKVDSYDGIDVDGGYAYLTSRLSDNVVILNVSNPSEPSFVANITSNKLASADQIQVAGSYAYVTAWGSDNFVVIDISNPANPVIAGNVSDSTNLPSADHLDVSGDYAYVTDNDRVTTVDISDPSNPSVAGSVQDLTELNGALDIEVSGSHAYVSLSGGDGIAIVDMSDPSNPTVETYIDGLTNRLEHPREIDLADDYLFVPGYYSRSVVVFDVSDPANPRIVATIEDSTNLNDVFKVEVKGRRAYTISDNDPELVSLSLHGTTTPSADIGSLKVDELYVDDEAVIDKDVDVRSGLNVGDNGIKSDGRVAAESLEVTGTKNFVQSVNETHSVVYTSSESGRPTVEYSTSAAATPGGNYVEYPAYFRQVLSSEEPVQVFATPVKSLEKVVVAERNATGFVLKARKPALADIHVRGVRKGFEDQEVWRTG